MKSLRLANYGIRGTVGDALTPTVVIDFACAFGTLMEGGTILVGRDVRFSSPMLHAAVVSGLLSVGCDVVDLGVCPTPILQYLVPRLKARGGVSVTGGHNRMGFNALTLINATGAYIEPLGGETVLEIYHARDFAKKQWNSIGVCNSLGTFAHEYFDALQAAVDVDSIRKAGFKVIIDPANGAGCGYVKSFADRLGIEATVINGDESGFFAHDPEPRPRNARQAAAIIRPLGAHVGFVCSSDMSRVSVVSEQAETLSEEYTFPLIANHVLAERTGVVVTNCCTTRTLDRVVEARGGRLVRTPVGPAYVMSAISDECGVIGGEGNGSVILPEFSAGSDGFLMMAKILEAMAQHDCTVSELLEQLERFHVVKKSVHGPMRRCYRAIEAVDDNETWCQGAQMDMTDGIRADWPDGWLHVRASRTESLIRVTSESIDERQAEARTAQVVRILEDEL
jgi:phosphomannomutase